jgi:hypothetical protein
LDQLTSVQISEWEAYNKIDPIGTWRDDFRFAKLTALLQNIVSTLYAEKGTKPKLIAAIDEMPDWLGEKEKEPEEKQSWQDMKSIFMSIAKEHNAKVTRENIITPPPKIRKR